jgi:hypothetical protein
MRHHVFPLPIPIKLNKAMALRRFNGCKHPSRSGIPIFPRTIQNPTKPIGSMKKQIRILTTPLLALAVVSCASQQPDTYDTPNPYGVADSGQQPPYGDHAPNPVYDTPAAYEEGAPIPTQPPYADVPAIPTTPGTPAIASGTPIIHTVVKGDTLSGLSSKYNVPIASIKQANQMTNDIVVLGRKMVIPPR